MEQSGIGCVFRYTDLHLCIYWGGGGDETVETVVLYYTDLHLHG